ncbi:MAG: hypothetical protein HGB14_08865 [Anaerolineaceae bacterium]|nr:hypothetical protein [Anaerolineaceae bacterium]
MSSRSPPWNSQRSQTGAASVIRCSITRMLVTIKIGIIAGLIILLIDGIIIWIAVQRFKRAKLILE